MTNTTTPPPPPDDWYDPTARPTLEPGEREEWRAIRRPERAFLAFALAGFTAIAGMLAYVLIGVVREYPLEFALGSLAVSACAWVCWMVAGVILRREEARRQR